MKIFLSIILTLFTSHNVFSQKLEGEFRNNWDFSIYLNKKYVVLNYSPEVCCNPPTWDTGTYRIINDTLEMAFSEIKNNVKYNLTFGRNGFHTRNRNNKLVRIYFSLPDRYYGYEKYQFEDFNFDKYNIFFYNKKGNKIDSLKINPWNYSQPYEMILSKSTNKIKANFGKGIKGEYILPNGFNEFNITLNLNGTGTYGRNKYTKEFIIEQRKDTILINGLVGFAIMN